MFENLHEELIGECGFSTIPYWLHKKDVLLLKHCKPLFTCLTPTFILFIMVS